MSDATTRGVRVQVQSAYVADRSSPRESHYFFAYRIRISNQGEQTVQLVSRHWVITDGDGNVEHVKGPGVVGEQPVGRRRGTERLGDQGERHLDESAPSRVGLLFLLGRGVIQPREIGRILLLQLGPFFC